MRFRDGTLLRFEAQRHTNGMRLRVRLGLVLVMFAILIIIGWALWALPHVPNFIWICYALACVAWLIRFGYNMGSW